MKQSRTFIQTLREMPKDADVVSQQLMLRAGMISKVAAGIYNYLPLALRSIRKVEQIVREELERDGCQELLMPMVQPAERLEKELTAQGIEVLLDDRDNTSPGVKFKDADLLGFPLRLTIGARGLKEGIVELRDRRTKEVSKHKPEEIVHAVLAAKERMFRELEAAARR